MALKQEDAILTALATAAVVYAVYQTHLPPVAGARASGNNNGQGNPHLNVSRRSATVLSAGVVGAISLLAKSPTVFLVGGVTVIVLDLSHRAANVTDGQTGQLPATGPAATAAPVGD